MKTGREKRGKTGVWIEKINKCGTYSIAPLSLLSPGR
jgi:hypothetical protein